ncbi:hypothetical protein AGABI1DRAFT_44775 [Agaricus bisporus var. burnettii JB137-S8]|uniref:PARP-type domain-containing protein n=1 Tax=Agaricus bisporus var. burnettii (strain JB137-S8 / ATCC MYA-4627 / FGSC 10392) TaxID=597362 RepID=K5VPW1_AGABU|nr:uncharacterized protein AGABI1DRAFT_44775 [Agaricus bisporus var. burnettii JB137-S8]EKM76509.1 hypothetical protein AGABI1DRAFT_44775 [Agaricus bisporus var. burnettii JB137-S8]
MSGYRLEYAPSARSKCKGPKPCAGTVIAKGDFRFGTLVEFKGNHNFSWRHWGCVTPKILDNVKKSIGEATEIDGYDELNDEDKAKVSAAWDEGHVADADIPDSARKPEGEEEEKPKRKAATKKAAKKDEDDDEEEDEEEEAEEKPKKKVTKKAAKKVDADEDGEGEVTEKPKKARTTKKV